jgi:hypothetical protein
MVVFKVLRKVRRILSLVARLSDKRTELLTELDKTVAEIKSLGAKIRGVADKLGDITKIMSDYVFTRADRLPGSYFHDPPSWESSDFDLSQLKKDYMRLKELIQKRDDLEKQLGITIK